MAVEALYLHIPFCRTRCAYCDFDTCALAPAAFEREATRYLAALERRIDEFGARGALASVRTVYIGGGTPTVLGADRDHGHQILHQRPRYRQAPHPYG